MTGCPREQTCCFLLTPPGVGALAVIRVRGPGAATTVADLFRPATGDRGETMIPDPSQPRRLCYGQWEENGETIDDVIVCAGTSHDDIPHVDINAHAGWRIVQRILLALKQRGVVIAEADEAYRDA